MREPTSLSLGRRTFGPDDLVVMAIVNRTPDSFFDQGAFTEDAAALAAVDRAVDEGAQIVDIGGVKAGPGPAVDAREEIRRTACCRGRDSRSPPRFGDQRGHLAGRGRPGSVRRGRRPAQRRVGRARPASCRGGRLVRGRPRVQPRRRPAAADRPAPGGLRRRRRRRRRNRDRSGRPRGRRGASPGLGSWSIRRTTSARTPTTRWSSPVGWTSWSPPVGRCWSPLSNKDFLGELLGADKDNRLEATLAATAFSRAAGRAGVPRPPGGRDPAGPRHGRRHPWHRASGGIPPRSRLAGALRVRRRAEPPGSARRRAEAPPGRHRSPRRGARPRASRWPRRRADGLDRVVGHLEQREVLLVDLPLGSTRVAPTRSAHPSSRCPPAPSGTTSPCGSAPAPAPRRSRRTCRSHPAAR